MNSSQVLPGFRTDDERIDHAVHGLRLAGPGMSAHRVMSRRQYVGLIVALVLIVGAGVLDLADTARVVIIALTALYSGCLIYRLVLVKRGLDGSDLMRISDQDALALTDDELPVYTILVPAFREPEVIGRVIAAMAGLNYPAHKLDIKLLLEADDHETIAAARASIGDSPVSIVLVPEAEPRTKPKACNYGLQLATGEFVTIYDAEDRPDPLQLRKAVVALGRLGPGYACVQARLGYFNDRQNMITKWFAIEYGTWFRFLLPGLVASSAPIPLGGTSNHFRTELLKAIGAWDPFNVTEDADLGIRLARLGYSVAVLDSVTQEEANSDLVNWVKQRSRWYKGYLQTWLVHMREPVTLWRELGWRGSLGFHLFVLGTPLTSLFNPIFWGLAVVWFVKRPDWLAALFPSGIYYLALLCFIVGNCAVVYTNMLTTRVMNRPGLLVAAVLVPFYWLMMAAAAAKAAYQLVFTPSYWEKTAHGLSSADHESPSADHESPSASPQPFSSPSPLPSTESERPPAAEMAF